MHSFVEYAIMLSFRQYESKSMRTFGDRVRHALLFEAVALAIFIPGSAAVFGHPVEQMGFIGIASATLATLWNFVFNVGFDRAMRRLRGSVHKTLAIRVTHTLLFEAGLVVMLIPLIAWYLGIGLWQALLMDLAIVVFYLVYGFLFNLAYDRIFPIAAAAPAALNTGRPL
ncbi:membrane protein [Pseudoduganella albidiflava]|uniref:Membrane protein n=2 Tax=Pseudoduganella albidiflava TaxID=321983 RepID=A0AA88C1S6_9BURK|nr:membrane protein [Pseudoduganella albidiflava]